ncbi:phycobiliprotein lyase [Leptodesmis sp.]|uniref:phycobiliprotein lyase n=1 Tax=Leptodesmis sp. TaxID=3100501 RepID=UPI0040534B46
MTYLITSPQLSGESRVAEFFQRSEGQWRSERRYFTLKNDQIEEMESLITIRFLAQGHPELVELAQMHSLGNDRAIVCGAYTSWESNYRGKTRKQQTGSTVFGVHNGMLYRDRGFATPAPVFAKFSLPEANTLRLRTEYNSSVFEEEIKLISSSYRTRQTIISRAEEQIMIGQYLEKRV